MLNRMFSVCGMALFFTAFSAVGYAGVDVVIISKGFGAVGGGIVKDVYDLINANQDGVAIGSIQLERLDYSRKSSNGVVINSVNASEESLKVTEPIASSANDSITEEQQRWLENQVNGYKNSFLSSNVFYFDGSDDMALPNHFSASRQVKDRLKSILESSGNKSQEKVLIIYGMHSLLDKKNKKVENSAAPSSSVCMTAYSMPATLHANHNIYGIIEIGGSGIKGVIIKPLSVANEADEDANVKNVIVKKFPSEDVNPSKYNVTSDRVKATVANFISDIKSSGVSGDNVYVVGSSSINSSDYKQQIGLDINAILAREGVSNKVEFVTEAQEACYGFNGVLHLVPKKWRRADNRSNKRSRTIFIDIGGGNSKGAYIDEKDHIATFSMKWGTKTFSKEVDAQRGQIAFAEASKMVADKTIIPAIREVVDGHPLLASLDRVYLVGGVAWGFTNLQYPNDNHKFPQLKVADIDRFYEDVKLSNPCDKKNYSNTIQRFEIEKICDVDRFGRHETLISGIEVLHSFSDEFRFKKKSAVFFFRDSLYLWPIGFVMEKLNSGRISM